MQDILNKKAQMKIQEMAFMIVGLVILFSMVAIFFIIFQSSDLKQSVEFLNKQKAISTVAKLSETPELSCGNYESLCVDADKLIILKNKTQYRDFWQVESFVIQKINNLSDIECNRGNYNLCNTYTLKQSNKNQTYYSSFLVICRKELKNDYSYDLCELGKAIVGLKNE